MPKSVPAALANLKASVEQVALALAHLRANGARAADLARAAQHARHQRGQFFPEDLLGEPGWDLALALLIADDDASQPHLSGLFKSARVSTTTGLRLIDSFEAFGLAVTFQEPGKRNRKVQLTEKGRAAISAALIGSDPPSR